MKGRKPGTSRSTRFHLFFVVAKDEDHSIEEKRFIILGESHGGRLLVVAYAERGKDTRIISAREATPKERKNYEKEI